MPRFQPGDVVVRLESSHPEYGLYRGDKYIVDEPYPNQSSQRVRLVGVREDWYEGRFELVRAKAIEPKKRYAEREYVHG